MSFVAKYDGRCNSDDCDYGDGILSVGDECEYFDNLIMHKSCASRAKVQSTPLCGHCFTYHKGECL